MTTTNDKSKNCIIKLIAIMIYRQVSGKLGVEYRDPEFTIVDDKLIVSIEAINESNIEAEFDMPENIMRVKQHIHDIVFIANQATSHEDTAVIKDYFDMTDIFSYSLEEMTTDLITNVNKRIKKQDKDILSIKNIKTDFYVDKKFANMSCLVKYRNYDNKIKLIDLKIKVNKSILDKYTQDEVNEYLNILKSMVSI